MFTLRSQTEDLDLIGRGGGNRPTDLHINLMNYVLALLLPPLSILFAGRPILAVLVFLIWLPAIIFSGGLGHPIFVVLAWILIWQGQQDARAYRTRRD